MSVCGFADGGRVSSRLRFVNGVGGVGVVVGKYWYAPLEARRAP